MQALSDSQRYLTDFDAARAANILTDVLVIGSGVAGSRAAIEAAGYGSVIIITKAEFNESATRYAQGGIACPINPDDSVQAHFDDTMRVGCYLNDPDAVRLLVTDGPKRVTELMDWGIEVDRSGFELVLGREGGHSRNRIVHAHGDQTGLELARTLERRIRQSPSIRVFEHCFLIDLLTHENRCVGAVTYHENYGHQLIWARQTVLASGGCGRIFRESTNPITATGDGLAAAFRAGARLRDMEMVQFHPTTLYVAGASRTLISEAVRGEGAYLVDRTGERFMTHYHPDGELAPRDIVSRAIQQHLSQTRTNCVYLDVRHLAGFAERFPFIARLCKDFEIDVRRDLIPVRPAAHYMIGGVETALDGSTTMEGLLSCGEAACSGVHGANRLASNSLLEGLVFGRIAGETAGQRAKKVSRSTIVYPLANTRAISERTQLDLADIRNSLASVMWRNVGIVRCADRLSETCDILNFWDHYTLDKTFDSVEGWELQNQLTVARLIAMSAGARRDSIGVHYRSDADASTSMPAYHLTVTRNEHGTEPVKHSPRAAGRHEQGPA